MHDAVPRDEDEAVDTERTRVARVAATWATGLLDTPPEEAFDSISLLASRLLDTPAGFFSIVDSERDFYKSQVGFPAALAASRELSGRTFCHYALISDAPLAIADTLDDPKWRSIPTVSSHGVRAYLGAPVWAGGEPIGSLCVIDTRPRQWTAMEVETLSQLSKSIGREIDLRGSLAASERDAEAARAVMRAREELTAVAAHDLRSPLQTIALGAALLGRSIEPSDQANAKRMTAAASSMSRLVEDMLASNAIESPAQHRRARVPVQELLEDAADALGSVAVRAGMSLAVGASCRGEVFADRAQMLRAIGNVISNSLKYCPPGSRVELGASHAGSDVGISITDDGPGMGAADLARAFVRGWQGANGVARQDGAGLGLSIVRSLVEQNGGRVAIASTPSEGVRVEITLPLSPDSVPKR